jgi:hypothetical protein
MSTDTGLDAIAPLIQLFADGLHPASESIGTIPVETPP